MGFKCVLELRIGDFESDFNLNLCSFYCTIWGVRSFARF